MTGNLHFLFLIVVLLLCVGPAQAGLIEDEVSTAISTGIASFFVDLTDQFINMSVSSSYGMEGMEGNPGNVGLDAIFTIATFTPDPFEMPLVIKMRTMATGVFFDVWWLIIIFMLIGALVVCVMPLGAIIQVNDSLGYDFLYALKMAFGVIIGGIFVLMLEMAFVWVCLVVNKDITAAIMMGSLNAIASSPDNWVLYCVMGIAYALLYLCFVYRAIVITMFAGLAPLIGLATIFPPTSNIGWNLHMYFIQMVFYQMIVVLWYSCCVIIVSAMPQFQDAIYQIMVFISIWISYKFLFRIDFVRGAATIGRLALYKKL